jgi:hypothetical protein
MKKIFVLTTIFFFSLYGLTAAHPPTDLELTYDDSQQMLHVKMTHVSHNLRKHYIRTIIVYKNDEEILQHRYPTTQTSPGGVEDDFPLKAVKGDVIRVKASCSQGGIGEQTLKIRPPQKPEKK